MSSWLDFFARGNDRYINDPAPQIPAPQFESGQDSMSSGVLNPTVIPSTTLSQEEFDKLSPEDQAVYDESQREREKAEQDGQ